MGCAVDVETKFALTKALKDGGIPHLYNYNAKRPHESLGLKSPLQYMIENNQTSQKYLTYTSF